MFSSHLQWSHGLPAMDTMHILRIAQDCSLKLQWSHGLPAMDTRNIPSAGSEQNRLQWSHGLPAMDTRSMAGKRTVCRPRFNGAMASQPWILRPRPRMVANRVRASMEPWPPSHGYKRQVLLRADLELASMEPWPPSHGYGRRDQYAGVCLHHASMEPWPPSHGYAPTSSFVSNGRNASMEPWPPSHGYSVRIRLPLSRPDCFNGAMASQPWIQLIFNSSSVCQPLLQWSHGLPAMDTSMRAAGPATAAFRFNGAMASQPWIRRRRRRKNRKENRASMEPWPPSHGYYCCNSARGLTICASMEPWPPSHGYQSAACVP